ncbi:GNAT family N-acetyltransferase [Thalassobius sp. S69A]|uniref:GNAT family N-acetyltransferase n=1 Tax=unclassified Thalassovita TaxID=2619711 RepID=UPI003C79A843
MKPTPLQQSVQYETALRKIGTDLSRDTGVLRLHKRLAGLPVTYVPRGMGALHGLTVINAPDPQADRHLHAQGCIPVVTPQTLAIMDLTAKDADRRAAQHGKWRNRLRRAEAAPLRITQGPFDPAHHGWLLQHETAQRQARGYRALPHAFVTAYPRQDTLLIQALHQGQPVAAMLFLLHSSAASYHIGWASHAGRRLNAHPLLLWRAAQLLHRRGFAQLDLGTLDTQSAPGLARFKLGSGARPVVLGHSWLHLPLVSPLLRAIRHWGGIPSGLLRKGSIGGPRTSQDTPHGSAQHRHYRPR